MSEYEHSVEKSKSNAGSGKVPAKLLRLFALYENLIQFALPLCTGVPDRPFEETPVSQSNNIVDISGVGLKQFWNLKGHMQDASTLATAHYPETLDRIFVSTSGIIGKQRTSTNHDRSLVLHPSFQPSGIGSRSGSIPLQFQRFSFCPLRP